MIASTLKPCCNVCANFDIDCDQTEVRTINGIRQSHTIIRCRHEEVCKAYLECQQLYKVSLVNGKAPTMTELMQNCCCAVRLGEDSND